MRRGIVFAIIVSIIFCAPVLAYDWSTNPGDGSGENPYQISTPEQLMSIGSDTNLLDKAFVLTQNIEFAPSTYFNIIGSENNPFTGSFDGQNYTISKLHIFKQGANKYSGMFGYVKYTDPNAIRIKNINLFSPALTVQKDFSGCLAGYVESAAIQNCHLQGIIVRYISRNYIGGVFGAVKNCKIAKCTASGSMTMSDSSPSYIGGLTGYSQNSVHTECYTEIIIGKAVGYNIGGMIGYNDNSEVESCSAKCNIEGFQSVGGLIGKNYGKIVGCNFSGSVRGTWGVGGMVGSHSGILTQCTTYGSVLGRATIGGLVGGSYDSTISFSSSSCQVKAYSSGGGLVGISLGNIVYCFADGDVTADYDNCGGLVGTNHPEGQIEECYATGKVHCGEGYQYGGLVGSNYGLVKNSYAKGAVAGTGKTVGGFAGANELDGTIICCYSSGVVNGQKGVGAFVGANSGTVYLSYWDIDTSQLESSSSGIGKTTIQMKSSKTFDGWGFDGVWVLDESNDYPRLFWENTQGKFIIDEQKTYGGGDGSIENPYQIWTAEQLYSIGYSRVDFDKHFKLMSDVVLDPNKPYTPIGLKQYPFSGSFEGNFLNIGNLRTINTSYSGLFGYVCRDDSVNVCYIRNVALANTSIETTSGYVGSVAGYTENVELDNCHIHNCIVKGNRYMGGFIGYSKGSIIRECSLSGVISGQGLYQEYAGGLIGWNEGNVFSCKVRGNINGESNVGGLIGYHRNGDIRNCHSISNIEAVSIAGGLIGDNYGNVFQCSSAGLLVSDGNSGGLAGTNTGRINSSFSTVSITGDRIIGGFIGINRNEVRNCYATGIVSGCRTTGGFFGANGALVLNNYFSGKVENCGWWELGPFAGNSYYGEMSSCYYLIPSLQDNGYGTSLDDANMKVQDNFDGWDFFFETANGTEDIWFIREGIHYPKLWWEHHRAVANAGSDETAYAWVDGFAEVGLDGTASWDADGDALTYAWYNDANELIAVGAEPNVVFGVGEYVIHLVVNDGIEDSEPNACVVMVVAPDEVDAKFMAGAISSKSKKTVIKGRLEFAGAETPELDAGVPMMLLAGELEIEATSQKLVYSPEDMEWHLTGEFEIDAAAAAELAAGENGVTLVSRYASGQWVYGMDSMKVLNKIK